MATFLVRPSTTMNPDLFIRTAVGPQRHIRILLGPNTHINQHF